MKSMDINGKKISQGSFNDSSGGKGGTGGTMSASGMFMNSMVNKEVIQSCGKSGNGGGTGYPKNDMGKINRLADSGHRLGG